MPLSDAEEELLEDLLKKQKQEKKKSAVEALVAVKRPLGVSFIGLMMVLISVVYLIASALFLFPQFFGVDSSFFFFSIGETPFQFYFLYGIFAMVLGAVYLVSGIAFFKGKVLGGLLGIVVTLLGIVIAIISVYFREIDAFSLIVNSLMFWLAYSHLGKLGD